VDTSSIFKALTKTKYLNKYMISKLNVVNIKNKINFKVGKN